MSENASHHELHDSAQHTEDEEVRKLFVSLITFVATAKAPHDAKNDALDSIARLQARFLP